MVRVAGRSLPAGPPDYRSCPLKRDLFRASIRGAARALSCRRRLVQSVGRIYLVLHASMITSRPRPMLGQAR